MEQDQPTPLVGRLKQVSAQWVAATGRSLGALATIVANHGSFFERLDSPGAGTTTATLEKFARFLIEADNWPEGDVPQEVARFAHAVGISAAAGAWSPDIAAESIGAEVPEPDAVNASAPSGRMPAASCAPSAGGLAGASAAPATVATAQVSTGAGAADDTSAALRQAQGERKQVA